MVWTYHTLQIREIVCVPLSNIMCISVCMYVYMCIYIYIYIYIYMEKKIATQISDKSTNSANAIFGAVVAQSMT